MRRFLRDNGLSVFFLALFLAALVLQALAGHADFNEDQVRHGNPTMSLGRYVVSSAFGMRPRTRPGGRASTGSEGPCTRTRC